MKISDVSVPQVYKEESADFRFFLKWFENSLTKIKYDTENLPDLYDPLRCPGWLLWMLADTMGFKYDDRLTTAYNRLVLVYFMSMIRNKGSKDGVTLAAECNLAQFNILEYGKEKDILNNRLEDTSIPVNAVSVTPHTPEGFIEVVYFSDKIPINACIEYVRPLGMYLFEYAGVRMDAHDKIAIDARLTRSNNNVGMSIGPTHVGHYSREDYARLQKVRDREIQGDRQEEQYIPYTHESSKIQYAPITQDNRDREYDQSSGKTKREIYQEVVLQKIRNTKAKLTNAKVYGTNKYSDTPFIHDRQPVFYRNSEYEQIPTQNSVSPYINPGYRALYSLQLANNEHIVKSLVPVNPDYDPDDPNVQMKDREPIFGLGYRPTDVLVFDPNREGPLPDEADMYGDTVVFRKNEDGDFYLAEGTMEGVYNLRYDKDRDLETVANASEGMDIWVNDEDRTSSYTKPRPAVNPIMTAVGDAMSLNSKNNQYVLREDRYNNYPPQTTPIQGEPSGTEYEQINNPEEPPVVSIYKIKTDGELDGKVTQKSEVDTD